MQYHDVNVPWIDSLFFDRRLAQRNLDEPTRAMVKFYADNGYVIIDPEISDVDGVAQEIVGACAPDPEYQQRLLDEWERVPAIRRLARRVPPEGDRDQAASDDALDVRVESIVNLTTPARFSSSSPSAREPSAGPRHRFLRKECLRSQQWVVGGPQPRSLQQLPEEPRRRWG
jgi:hypothetical protein